MKRKHGFLFAFVVLLIAAMFTMAGCDNDGDDGDGTGGGGGSNELIGTAWRYTDTETSLTVVMTFTDASNVTYTYSDGTSSDIGTYTVSGNTITLSLFGQQQSGTITGNKIQFDGLAFTKVN
jgi:Ca2+-binding RTX toxin-like protein